MRRLFLISLFSIIVLGTVATGVGWYLLQNEAFIKSQLSAQTLKYTGRELKLNGPVKLQLGRVTTLEANDVHFANAAWAEKPDMASAGHLKVSIDLSSLFDDQIIFPALDLQDCKVNLSKKDSGEPNWEMGPEPKPQPEPELEAQPREILPVAFRDLQVQNCGLFLSGPNIEEPLDIEISGIKMLNLESGRWQGDGSGSFNERPLSFSGWLSPFDSLFLGGPLEHSLELAVGEYRAQSSGSVNDALTGEGANLTTKIYGPDMAELLREFGLPLFSEGPYDFQLKLNTEQKMTRLDLNGDLGSVKVKANGELDRLIRPRDGNINISIDGPNLGALAQVFGVEGLVEEAFSHVSKAEFSGETVHIKETHLQTDSDQLKVGGHFNTGPGFTGTELDIQFKSDEVGRWTTAFGQPQQKLGPLILNSKLKIDANRQVSIDARAEQDATTLDVQGTLGSLPDSMRPDLNITFQSPDPSHLAAIVVWDEIPAAPLTIQGRVHLDGSQVQLGKVHIDLAGDVADIDGVINLSDHFAGSQLTVQTDIKDTGKLGRLFGRDGFPDQPFKLSAEVTPDGEGLAIKVSDSNLGDTHLKFDGRIPDLQKPLMMDGNFDINLPRLDGMSLLLPKIKLPGAPFSARGKLQRKDNGVQFENVIIDLAGDQAKVNGLLKLENRYAGSDLRAELDIKSAAALGRLFGQEGLPDEPFKFSIAVRPNGKGMAFEAQDGGLRDAQVDIRGQIPDMDQPFMMDASFDIRLPRLSEAGFLFPDKTLPEMPFTASGKLKNRNTKTQLNQVEITLKDIKLNLDGDFLPDNRFQLTLKSSGPDASVLSGIAGTDLPADSFSLETRLAGSTAEFELGGLDLRLGDSKVNGDLQIRLGKTKGIRGKLQSDYLDLSPWYPGEENTSETTPAKNTGTSEWLFVDEPLWIMDEDVLDIDLDLQLTKLFLGNTTIEEAEFGLSLSNEVLQVKPFRFKGVLGGGYIGEFRLDASGRLPKLHIEASGNDVRLGLASLPDQDPMTYPPIDAVFNLDGTGATYRDMASSLNGTSRIYMGPGKLANAGLDLLYTDFLTQLTELLNPFSQSEKYTQLNCAVLAVDIVDGQVEFIPSVADMEKIAVFSEGSIDLKTEKINIIFATKPKTGLGLSAGNLINSMIKVGGRLTSPAIEVDAAGTITSGGLAVVTLGISVLAKGFSDRFLSSTDPCGDARKALAKRDSTSR